MRAAFFAICCLVMALGVGCQPLIRTPPRFLQLDEAHPDYQYRATTADGVVLAARVLRVDRERGGGLDFWLAAVKMRLRGAYALRGERAIKTTHGLEGKQLRFAREEKQRPYQYWVTLFVDGNSLAVVEAGGPEARFAAYEEAIDAAIRSTQP